MKVTNSVELHNKEFPPITFVVEEFIPAGLNVIEGLFCKGIDLIATGSLKVILKSKSRVCYWSIR